MLGSGIGQLLGDDARLHHRLVVQRVDGEDSVHPAHGKGDAAADRQRATAETGASTRGRHGHAVAVCPREDRRDLRSGFRFQNHIGHEHQILRLVRTVFSPLLVAPMDASSPHQSRQISEGGLVDVFGQGRGGGRSRFHGRCVILGACQK